MWSYVLSMVTILIGETVSQKCCVEIVNQNIFGLFTVQGRELDNKLLQVRITPCNNNATSVCVLEEDAILRSQVNETDLRNLVIAFVCTVPMTVRLVPGSMSPLPNTITYIQTHCRMFMDDIERLSALLDIKVVSVLHLGDLVVNASRTNCSSLAEVGSFSVINTHGSPPDIFDILRCDARDVVEVILQNVSMTSIDNFSTLMPRLQCLDLTYNNFTRPPYFPWNSHRVNLPRNLSRNNILQSHYTYFNAIDIPANVYVRELKLSYNPYLNLTDFRFHGWIDKLSLSGCNLAELPADVFSNVEKLQYLELSENKLNSLPSGIFHSLPRLRKLDLQGNNLSEFESDTFSSIRELTSLNLANNSITSLQNGIFYGLLKLDLLYLQNNNIRYINQSAFKGINTHLRVINLHNNPIQQFPESVILLRGLQKAYLTNTSISEIDFVRLEKDLSWNDLVASLADSLSTGTTKLKEITGEPRILDLSGSQIKSFVFWVTGLGSYLRLSLILKHFKIILDNNPITCDCNILNLTYAVKALKANNSLTGREYMFEGWICKYPKDLEGRKMFSVLPEETYCEIRTINCPYRCKCFQRSVVKTVIVDCRQKGLRTIPENLPSGKLELWLQDNEIENVDAGRHNKDILSLLLSRNSVHRVRHHVLKEFLSLRTLHLDDNLLASVPSFMKHLKLTSLRIGGNPFKCDCHALWMKKWILINNQFILDTENIKCVNSVSDEGKHVSLVPDEDFVCEISLEAFILPIVIPTFFVLLLLTLGLILFVMWQNFKVWLFVQTGLHPFDKKDVHHSCKFDVFVFYERSLVDWVQSNITEPLETFHRFKLFDMHRDSRLGVSFAGNISHAVESSKRIIYITTDDSEREALARMALDAALVKQRDQKANYFLPVVHNCSPKTVKNKPLQKYIKAKRFVQTQENNFLTRILYYLPQKYKLQMDNSLYTVIPLSVSATADLRQNGQIKNFGSHNENLVSSHWRNDSPVLDKLRNGNFISSHQKNGSPISSHHQNGGQFSTLNSPSSVSSRSTGSQSSIFVWYSDADFRFTMDNIVVPYEQMGYHCILADRNFVPGAAVQENILNAVQGSFRTVIILSEASARDEWLLFAFRFAYERQIKESTFLVGLLIRQDPEPEVLDEEISKYLESHVYLRDSDRWFRDKLVAFLKWRDNVWMTTESTFQMQYNYVSDSEGVCHL